MSHEIYPEDIGLSPSGEYIDKAERYLEEGKAASKAIYDMRGRTQADRHNAETRAQNLLLGSIAASLISLVKK
jgi:hypothetical protein